MRVAAVQLNSRHDKDLNLKTAVDAVGTAAEGGARFVLLPEYVDYLGTAEGAAAAAEPEGGPAESAFAEAARTHGVWLHCGSIRVAAPDGRSCNTSLVFAPDGSVAARYRKIHLFDVDIPDGVTYRESDSVAPGKDLVTCDVDEWRVGLSICYDLRFPELYRGLALAGATLVVVPAAFTFYTGRYHWEPLLRARAIENQAYVLAAGQHGRHNEKRETFGHSLLVDPWGRVVGEQAEGDGVVVATLDRALVDETRRNMPCAMHAVTLASPAPVSVVDIALPT